MTQFIVLVGNIGTGKTYYSKNYFPPEYLIVRPDDYKGSIETINRLIFETIEEGLANKQTIVLDGPNLEKSFRKQLLYFVRNYPNYKKVIYDFGHGNQETLNRIAEERQYRTYEQWSQEFYENMTLYEKPTIDEGFDEIIEINNNFA